MTWEFLDPGYLKRWVLGKGPGLNTPEEQDTPWIIADHFRAKELIDVASLQNALPERRDELLFCIGLRLEWTLDPNESDPENVPPSERQLEFDLLREFALSHSHDFVDRFMELGFGGDYDTIVIPYLKRQLEGRSSDT